MALPSFLLRVTPWTCSLMCLLCQPTFSSISCLGLPRPIFISLPLLDFIDQHSYYTSLFHYFIHRASLAHLLPLYLFYFHWLFTRSLDFLGPITTSLSLIIFWACWPLGRPIEFTNSFPRLPRPIYLFFTYFYSHELITSFFGLYWPTFLLCQPISLFHSSGFLGPFTSSLPLLLPLTFCWILRLPRPNYHIFTSYYFLGLLAFRPTHWIY